MLKEDLERNVTLCLHTSFCRNRESNVDPLLFCKQGVEEQKCWRTASNSVRIANRVSVTGGRHGTLTNGRKNKIQKERNLKNLEVLELLNDEKKRNKGVTKKKKLKLRIVLCV